MNEQPLSEARKLRIEQLFDEVPFAKFVGLELVEVGLGTAIISFTARDELRRNGGIVHGGATASLIDTAAAFAIMTILEPDQRTSTVDITIHFLRPIVDGKATAHARIVRSGRRIVIASVDVFDEKQVLLATALTTYVRL